MKTLPSSDDDGIVVTTDSIGKICDL